jgi:hypothetical protein
VISQGIEWREIFRGDLDRGDLPKIPCQSFVLDISIRFGMDRARE